MNVEIKALEAFQDAMSVDGNVEREHALIKAHDLASAALNKTHDLSIDEKILNALVAFKQAMFVDGDVERENALFEAHELAIAAWVLAWHKANS